MTRLFLSAVALIAALMTAAPEAGARELKFYNAETLPLLGKAIDDDASRCHYSRLPDSLETKVERRRLFTLGTNSTGMAVRFATASPVIAARWKSPWMHAHEIQSAVGVRGLDLYTLDDDGKTWRFINSAQPDMGSDHSEFTIIDNMEPRMREYMMYLSLYDQVDSLYIGVDEGYTVDRPSVALPSVEKPIVVYGSSLVQGPGASKPSMCHTNMLVRMLNREVINLGFGGHGQLDIPVAEVIAAVDDPGMIIIDCFANCTPDRIVSNMVKFYDVIRAAHPDVPILFIDIPILTKSHFDRKYAAGYDAKSQKFNVVYNALKQRGEKNIYLLEREKVFPVGSEFTVDGSHYTDEASRHLARVLARIINRRALK